MWPKFKTDREFFNHFFESELSLLKDIDDYTREDIRHKKDFVFNRWLKTKRQICDIRVAIYQQVKDDIRIQEMQDDRPDLY